MTTEKPLDWDADWPQEWSGADVRVTFTPPRGECILEKILREKYKGLCPICGMGTCKELTDYSGYNKLEMGPRDDDAGVTVPKGEADESKP